MRPVFFKLTLWNDPQEWDVCPIFRDACRAANRCTRLPPRTSRCPPLARRPPRNTHTTRAHTYIPLGRAWPGPRCSKVCSRQYRAVRSPRRPETALSPPSAAAPPSPLPVAAAAHRAALPRSACVRGASPPPIPAARAVPPSAARAPRAARRRCPADYSMI